MWLGQASPWPALLYHQTLDVPREMMDAVGGGKHRGSAGSEGEADQSMPRHLQHGAPFRTDLHDATFAGERGGHVQVAAHIEGKALRASQAAIERGYIPLRIDFVHAIETGSGRSGNEQVSVRT